jgi:ribulose 1,5-bisphosphate synthetase/thiazole synthase
MMLLEFALVVVLAVGSQANPLGRYAKRIDASELSRDTTYDFIVAGGGIAGLTVADRLTEDPKSTVLLYYMRHNGCSCML